MSVASMPIRRLVPLITVVIVIGALVAGGIAIQRTRSARASEKSLNSYLAAKEMIERFSLLDATTTFNGAVIIADPRTAGPQNALIATDTAEMGSIITKLGSASLTAPEHASISAVQAARDAFIALSS